MILITGGAGFIGTNLVSLLLSKGEKVLVIDNLSLPSCKLNIKQFKKSKNFLFKKIDIINYKRIEEVFEQHTPSSVINLAAETHVDKSILNPVNFVKSNIYGVFNLLEISRNYYNKLNRSKKNKFKFIHISTDEVYGSLKSNSKKFTESNKYLPSSPYSASKASSDHLVNAWYKTYGLPTVISNCSNNFGPHQYFEKLIPLTIINALNNENIPIYGKGHQIRDWLYVKDHCDAIYKLLKFGAIGETYNIGGGNEKSNNDTVRSICSYLDKIRPLNKKKKYSDLIVHTKDRPGHDLRYAVNSHKIKKQLNWRPKYNFQLGINETVEWYLANPDWLKISETRSFKRWKILQY